MKTVRRLLISLLGYPDIVFFVVPSFGYQFVCTRYMGKVETVPYSVFYAET